MRTPLIAFLGSMLLLGSAIAAVKAMTGPKTVCLRYSFFQLAEGETLTPGPGGMHGISFAIDGRVGRYELGESDILRIPKLGDRVFSKPGMRIYRIDSTALGDFRYVAIGKMVNWDDEDHALVLLGGAAFDDAEYAADIFARLSIGDINEQRCDVTFVGLSLD